MNEVIKNIIYVAQRFKLATMLNLVGLVAAFATFYLLMTQVAYQITYNKSIDDHELLYRMESDNVYNEWEFSNLVCRPFAEALQLLPEVDSYSLTYNSGNDNYTRQKFLKGITSHPDTLSYMMYPANNTAVSTLTSKILDGSIEWNDSDHNGIIIPARIAKEYFGTVKAEGKTMLAYYPNENYPFKVRGVYEDFPKNSELSNSIYYYFSHDLAQDSLALEAGYQCIVKFKNVPKDLNTTFVNKLKQAIIDHLTGGLTNVSPKDQLANLIKQVEMTNIKFTPLDESYFEHNSFTPGEKGYRGLLHLLILTSLLILVMAAINFLNFTLVESPMRIRGLNTRLVLGASRRSLRLGIVAEGIIISVATYVIAIIICHFLQFLPVMHKLTNGSLLLKDHLPLIMAMLALSVVVGIIASIYPSAFATSFSPARALKGSFGLTPQGNKLRKRLICMQLCISILMIIYLGILFQLSRFILSSEYGFDNDRILVSELPLPESYVYNNDNDTLYHDIIKMPGVEDVAFSESLLGITDYHSSEWNTKEDETFKFSLVHVSRNYLSTMGINITEGRKFSSNDTLAGIINQAVRNRWHSINLGSKVSTGLDDSAPDSATVVGICENIRYGTIRSKNSQPFLIVYKEGYELLGNLIVRLSPDADKDVVKQQIDDLLKSKYGSSDIKIYEFYELLVRTYVNEFRYVNQMVIICLICLIITLIGIFCLMLFETEYRRKEIGIRKVMGATTSEIMWMLCRQYVKYLLISFVVATPLAFFFGLFTLNYFNQHPIIQWWLFPLALLLVGGIMLGTVALQSWLAARKNPASTIKTE